MSNSGFQVSMAESLKAGTRQTVQAPFGLALAELAGKHEDVVGLTADLGKYTDILPFAKAFPDRYFNVGMAEQNLIAISAGLAKIGKVPFATTYGVFATRRAYEFIAVLCAHGHLNVKVFGALPGLTTSYGCSHQAIEDTGLMRLIPGLTVIDPCDATEIGQVVHTSYQIAGPVYVRLQRGNVIKALPEGYEFRHGKAQIVRQGSQIGIISTGLMTAHALDAAAALEKQGVSVAVLHAPCIKPFDAKAVVEFARSVERLATLENHVVAGGLATLVAEVLFEAGVSQKLVRMGLPDEYIECGSPGYLMDKYGISSARIEQKLSSMMKN
ncbi:transketolase C-terminal domain-containing protein [Mesorhizobium sp.]|uniref:transketolase family protein n=1 Tax=Mesorhizobium sp. TaxID=1871066 RepID=UPI000FE8DF1F|nr:transketolase C-terminal domain-containing protein [Mesorhizobium sp.]RWM45513.1 MAG: transketolase family protein [Mesorhizobium sp.]RWM58167.1 MAG: transketolase family protein [Mesorhizobium sp.]RWM58668.1 MAG: transketolase family protein [Mesorhizobium sp.]TIO70033.1 MAG: transketolase family protein [Mesorhizobium sp.]TIR25824.1 MAG: transketolase family protein [Mesorhizobium sp.]